MRVTCTCSEYGTDLACPQHGAAENARRLRKAKREMRLLLRMLKEGVPLEEARGRAHEAAWGVQTANPLRVILQDVSLETCGRRKAWRAVGRWQPQTVRVDR